MFGFLEFEEDPEVLDALLAAAESWLRERGCDRMVGPMDFVLNEESGVLTEGFALEPLIRQPWHPPYYQQQCEAAGLTKAMDLFSWGLDIGDRDDAAADHPRARRAGAHQARDHDPQDDPPQPASRPRRVRGGLQRRLVAELGLRPLSKEDLDDDGARTAAGVRRATGSWSPRTTSETVAMAITIPDINQVLKKMNGRLLPLGWWYYLSKYKIIDRLRVGFLGVKPEYQHTGVARAAVHRALRSRRADAAANTARRAGSSRATRR